MKKVILSLSVLLLATMMNFNIVDSNKRNSFIGSDDYSLKQEKTLKIKNRMLKSENVNFENATNDSKYVSNAKAQIMKNDDNTYNIRFVSAIAWNNENNLYSKIGFDVNYYYNNDWFSYSTEVSTLYTTLTADNKIYTVENMTEFDSISNYKYFITYTLKNIPNNALDTQFTVKPYAYLLDGSLSSTKMTKKTSVNSVINGSSTFKVVSKFDDDNSSIKYIEPIHDRNSKNEIVGENNENVDKNSAKQNATLTGTAFLENVSAYSKFEYKYESNQAKGKFDIYASVASNGIIWGDVSTIWPGARNNGFIASRAIDFSKFLTLKNNDKSFKVSENAYIPETKLTKEMDPQTINADVTKDSWFPCVYFLLNNFQRIHIGTVDIVEGMNNITIDVGYNYGGFGYCESLCGNWENIELIYVDENIDKTVSNVKMISSPRTEYFVGEKFSLENAKFVGYNKDGVEIGYLDNDKIEIIDNGALLEDTRIRLKYEGAEFYVDVKVSNVIKQELNTLENMKIQYHDQTDEKDTRRANIYDTYLEKVSSGSYFEYVIESDKERTISISAEVATNAYIFNDEEGEYKDYNTGIEGFTQNYVGSYDLDLSKVVKLTNTVDNQTTTFETNKDAIAYGHVLNAKDDAEKAKIYKTTDADGNEKFDQWVMADALCMRNFKEMKLGEIKLSKGKNIIRISMNGYLNKNPFAYGGYACGNWKSISITF